MATWRDNAKTSVLVWCKDCRTWVTLFFEAGYSSTYEDPGMADVWYANDDSACIHEILDSTVNRIDSESFEDYSLESQYRLEAEGEAKYLEEMAKYQP